MLPARLRNRNAVMHERVCIGVGCYHCVGNSYHDVARFIDASATHVHIS